MGDAVLLHRIYTNAAEEGAIEGARGRIVPAAERDAAGVVSPAVLQELDDLLRKTAPASTRTGYVVSRFAGNDGRTYACVVASHPNLVDAADRRDGVLNHARLVAVTEPSFDVSSLLEVANDFPIADVCSAGRERRLKAYIDEVANESSVVVRPIAMSEMQTATLLNDVVLACIGALNEKRFATKIANDDAGEIARAWAALPAQLQIRSSWAVGVKDGCPVSVVFSKTDGKPPSHLASDSLKACVKKYEQLVQRAPDVVLAMLANPSLRDASTFADAVERAAAAPQVSSLAGKEEMSKKRNDPWPQSRTAAGASDDESRDDANRQLKAAAEVLRREMDDRLATFEAKLRKQSEAQSTRMAVLPLWIAIAVLTIAVAFLGHRAFVRQPRETGREPVTRYEPPASSRDREPQAEPEPDNPAVSPARQAVARAETSNQWMEELKNIIESDATSVAGLVDDLARNTSSNTLGNFGQRIANSDPLGSSGRDQLRLFVIDALANEMNANVKVDGKLADVDLSDLKKQYGVKNPSSDATSKSLQSEIVLRWIAGRER